MLPLYLLATFTGALLTFLLQPFVAKLVLPLFGGSAAVWHTSVLFFQVGLLAGYGYAYLLTTKLGPRRGAVLHVAVTILPLVVLPVEIGVEWAPTGGLPPLAWQLWLLTATVGLPFFVATSTAPLLQRWFSITPHAAAADPYFLYAASNFGSLIGLLAYPLLLEPSASLPVIARGWAAGYVLLVVLGARSRAAAVGDVRRASRRLVADRHRPSRAARGPPPAGRAPHRVLLLDRARRRRRRGLKRTGCAAAVHGSDRVPVDPHCRVLAATAAARRACRRAAGAELEVVLGDARLGLAAHNGRAFDLLVLNAFSSDAVPVHLLTREALRLYRSRLRPGGVIAVHISNRFLDLASVVGAVATDAGLEAIVWEDTVITDAQRAEGKLPSQWVVVTDKEGFLRRLTASAPWRSIQSGMAPWTDAFSNVAGALRWSGASTR